MRATDRPRRRRPAQTRTSRPLTSGRPEAPTPRRAVPGCAAATDGRAARPRARLWARRGGRRQTECGGVCSSWVSGPSRRRPGALSVARPRLPSVRVGRVDPPSVVQVRGADCCSWPGTEASRRLAAGDKDGGWRPGTRTAAGGRGQRRRLAAGDKDGVSWPGDKAARPRAGARFKLKAFDSS